MSTPREVWISGIRATLAAALTYNATSLQVDSGGDQFPESDFQVKIGNELIHVGTREGNTFSSLTRNHEGTSDGPHNRHAEVIYVVGAAAIKDGLGGSPGGGSQPSVIIVTFTAAEIAARWSVDDGGAAMELSELPQGRWLLAAPIVEETLDNNVSLSSNLLAYLAGAESSDALDGENIQMGSGGAVTVGTYQSSVEIPLIPGTPNKIVPGWLATGCVAYAPYYGDAAPTSGSASFAILLG